MCGGAPDAPLASRRKPCGQRRLGFRGFSGFRALAAVARTVHHDEPVERASIDFDRILVPTDFGEPAERAIELAVGLAKKHGAKITLMHVYELPPYPFGSAESA